MPPARYHSGIKTNEQTYAVEKPEKHLSGIFSFSN